MTYLQEQLHVGDLDVTMIYPDESPEALTGALGPALTHKYPFKVKVSKTAVDKRYKIRLIERTTDGHKYDDLVIETHRRWTKAGAMRKANRLIRRGINMGGVL